MKPLQTRKESFYDELIPYVNEYGKDLIREFYDHWIEHNEPITPNTKLAFEKKKTWQLSRRIRTWKRNSEKWIPEFKKEGYKRPFPNYYDKRLATRLPIPEHQQYMIHLESKGFSKGSGPGGTWIKPPNAEIIWL